MWFSLQFGDAGSPVWVNVAGKGRIPSTAVTLDYLSRGRTTLWCWEMTTINKWLTALPGEGIFSYSSYSIDPQSSYASKEVHVLIMDHV
jgi:hypothetical protein